MSMSTNLHHVNRMTAKDAGGTGWLNIYDASGNQVTVFMPIAQAEAIVEAFDGYEDWLSGQEGPTFDDALAAKCDAEARDKAALALK